MEENHNSEELSFSPLEGHTYAVNHVEFSRNGDMLASCSLDGSTIIWDPTVSVEDLLKTETTQFFKNVKCIK